jgi:hypothetical protein
MIGLCEAVQETVRTLFGEPLIAELTEEDVKAAVAGNRTPEVAWKGASDRLLAALKSGELTGFAVQAARQIRVPLPARYWSEWIAERRPFLTGRVEFKAGTYRDIPRELGDIFGWPAAIDQQPFRDWLEAKRLQADKRPAGELLETNQKVSGWLLLHQAVTERVEIDGSTIGRVRREMITAAAQGALSIRGVSVPHMEALGQKTAAVLIPAERFQSARKDREYGGAVEWHDGRAPPELTFSDTSGAFRYRQLEVEREPFQRWLLLTRAKRSKLPDRFVGMGEAFARLRRRIKKDEKRNASDPEIAQIITEHARRDRLRICWIERDGAAAPLFSGAWDPERLPAGLLPEDLILNGAIKANILVFVRPEFAQWLGDRPEEADPPPLKLEHRQAASIPQIAREWAREPGAEAEEKIAERLWRAFFDGEFALETEEAYFANFDRQKFAELIEINQPALYKYVLHGITRSQDPDFSYRALGAWAAEKFPGISTIIRLHTVDKYLLPRIALAEWCRRAGQRVPRFWRSSPDPRARSDRSNLPKKRNPDAQALRGWYRKRIRDFEKLGEQPSREDDYRDARVEFGDGITHDLIRSIRLNLAPHWTLKGRRPEKSGKNKSET